MLKKVLFIMCFAPAIARADGIMNPTRISSSTLPSGSTQYIQNLSTSAASELGNINLRGNIKINSVSGASITFKSGDFTDSIVIIYGGQEGGVLLGADGHLAINVQPDGILIPSGNLIELGGGIAGGSNDFVWGPGSILVNGSNNFVAGQNVTATDNDAVVINGGTTVMADAGAGTLALNGENGTFVSGGGINRLKLTADGTLIGQAIASYTPSASVHIVEGSDPIGFLVERAPLCGTYDFFNNGNARLLLNVDSPFGNPSIELHRGTTGCTQGNAMYWDWAWSDGSDYDARLIMFGPTDFEFQGSVDYDFDGSGNVNVTNTLTAGTLNSETIIDPSLANNSIVYSQASGQLFTSANLLFDGTKATIAQLDASTFLTTSSDTIKVSTGGVVARVGGSIFDNFSSTGNNGTAETNLYINNISSNVLQHNGDKLIIHYAGTHAGSTSSKEERIYVGTTTIFDTGAVAISATNNWDANVLCMRKSSSEVKCTSAIMDSGSVTISNSPTFAQVGGLNFNANITFKITAQASGVGAASNDTIAQIGSGIWMPSSQN